MHFHARNAVVYQCPYLPTVLSSHIHKQIQNSQKQYNKGLNNKYLLLGVSFYHIYIHYKICYDLKWVNTEWKQLAADL